jgi:hypothetical protein
MSERQAKDIALAERESAEVGINAHHGLIPGEKVPAGIRDIGRGRAHAIQNALERGADGCGERVGISGLLLAGQEKQMVALYSIQIKDPCQALQDLRGNCNSAAYSHQLNTTTVVMREHESLIAMACSGLVSKSIRVASP